MKNLIEEMRKDKQYGKADEFIVPVPPDVYEAIGKFLGEARYKTFSNKWKCFDLLGNGKIQIYLDHYIKEPKVYKADTYEEHTTE